MCTVFPINDSLKMFPNLLKREMSYKKNFICHCQIHVDCQIKDSYTNGTWPSLSVFPFLLVQKYLGKKKSPALTFAATVAIVTQESNYLRCSSVVHGIQG